MIRRVVAAGILAALLSAGALGVWVLRGGDDRPRDAEIAIEPVEIADPIARDDRRALRGGSIVFRAQPYGGEWGLYAINPDRTGLTKLVDGDASPFVSPDGRRIALVDGAGAISVVNADGSGRKRLVRAGHVACIAWSPDGTRIAYSTAPSPYPDADYAAGRLYVVRLDGSGRRLVARGAANVTWSPDGRWLAYDSRRGIVVARSNGRDKRAITAPGMGRAPTWSPRGRLIAFLHQRDVYLVDARGTGLRRVTRGWSGEGLSIDGPADVYNLRWSPDASALAFVRKAGGVEQLFRVRPDGSGSRRLTRAGGGLVNAFSWSMDGRWIAVSRGGSLSSTLLVMNADGSGRRTLSDDLEFADSAGWLAERLPAAPRADRSVLLYPARTLATSDVGRLSASGPQAALLPPEQGVLCGPIVLWNGITGSKRSVPGFACNPSEQGPSIDVYVEAELGRDRIAVLASYHLPMSGSEDYHVLVRMLDRPRPALEVAEAYYDYTIEEGEVLGNLEVGGDLVAFNLEAFSLSGSSVLSVLRQRGRGDAEPIEASGLVASVDDDRILLRAGRDLVLVDADGRQLLSMPGAPQAKLQGDDVVALKRGVLRAYDVAAGTSYGAWRVAGAREPVRLADVYGGVAAYLRQGRLHLLSLRSGRSAAVRLSGAERVRDVALETEGLFYASAREVGFVPRSAVLNALR